MCQHLRSYLLFLKFCLFYNFFFFYYLMGEIIYGVGFLFTMSNFLLDYGLDTLLLSG
jgi:hypothetical protein